MTAASPVLPPMLARPVFGPTCTYGPDGFCAEPATYEVRIVWPQHFEYFERLVRELEPVCDRHRSVRRDMCHSEADGAVFVERRLAVTP